MVNLILKFMKNPKKDGKVVAFFRKKICFVLSNSEEQVQPGDTWECFMWADRGKFFLVKPFKKVDPDKVKEEQARVDAFNQDLVTLERYKNEDFDKIVFDPDNRPYLKAKKGKKYIEEKYEDYVIKVVGKEVWARPILNERDRADFRNRSF